MKFRKVTATKYVGQNGYNLYKMGSSFSICKGSKVVDWGKNFQSVSAAENFTDSHHLDCSTDTFIPMNSSDIKFIVDMYGGKLVYDDPCDPLFDQFYLTDTYSIGEGWVEDYDPGLNNSGAYFYNVNYPELTGHDFPVLSIYKHGEIYRQFINSEEAFGFLDSIVDSEDLFASVILRGTELRAIFAKKDKRSSRDIVKNLIRVKSSNVWAYGVEIRDNNSKVGDVYVQFKGRNGGPDDVYKYYDVPVSLWRKFVGAPSKGHFVFKYLRNNFMYSKLTGDKRGKLPNAIN